ncbi:glycoside hydrolase family 95 protein [Galbibacter sp. EGI 63066]|uniref:glycoside hydrolase family 95 protein n=1 Tax=Galbibacter sp. EGI 63066 TaxID=2993559 RepID=UPI002249151B|nr:glycoside hydrolase family 95 protein [Galbibacter sp. EGI 63066]MCX2679763.1 glycoside hydrolase family 95 protein [Galbibacter sp. EGI 63066]
MKTILKIPFYFLFIILVTGCQQEVISEEKQTGQTVLWYTQPASKWMEALPVGNGRLGAMVFGDPVSERIQLNEDSMWPGGPASPAGRPDWGNSKGTKEDLDHIRQLIRDGKVHEADKEIVERFSYKGVARSHQTMGDLFIDFSDENKKVENYKRSLSLDDALSSVSYTSNGNEYTEKVFASAPDDVLVIQLETTANEGMDFKLRLTRPEDEGHPTVEVSNPSDNEISMKGTVTQYGGAKFSEPTPLDYGVNFETRLKVENSSGTVIAKDGSLELKGVKKTTVYIVGNTSFYDDDFEERNTKTLTSATQKGFDELLKDHIKDYQKLYKRVDFDLGGKELDSLPTDKRLARIKEGEDDPDLAAKLFQYGRYLLIGSSRPGTNPANLQGIWNEHIQAPWNADYHLNINLQMNYWPSNVTNLDELHEPLFDFIDRVIERGKITAKEQYGIERGAVIHHTTDLWATPWMRAEQPYWGSWIHGGGWIVQHYWEHYRYTQDETFLKERAYPAIKAMAEFYLDWLQKDPETGKWISYPETSPENSYIAEDGKKAAVAYGAAMGHQIIAEVFDNALASAKILGIKDDFIAEVKEKRENLYPGVVIGEDGRILEWNKAYDEPEKGHRHMSHLYALHPGDDITAEGTPEAFAAAQKVIDYRLQHGGAGTGWSRAWMINFNARLLNAEAAAENIKKLFQISIADNLFDEHPPFQIDGNFGYTAGVTELLMQSHEGFIRILPALPANWKNGSIKGLKARGNIEVDISWEDGKLKTLTLSSQKDKRAQLKYAYKEIEVTLAMDKKIKLDNNLNVVE